MRIRETGRREREPAQKGVGLLGWKVDITVKSTSCSFQTGFYSQHQQGDSQSSLTPVPQNLTPSCKRMQTPDTLVVHIYTDAKTCIHRE